MKSGVAVGYPNEPTTGIQKGSNLRYYGLVSFYNSIQHLFSYFKLSSQPVSNKYGSQEWKWRTRYQSFPDESFGPFATPPQRHERDTSDTNAFHRSK